MDSLRWQRLLRRGTLHDDARDASCRRMTGDSFAYRSSQDRPPDRYRTGRTDAGRHSIELRAGHPG